MTVNVKTSVWMEDDFVVFRKRRIGYKVKRLVETIQEVDSHLYCLGEDGYEGTEYYHNTCRIYDRLAARMKRAVEKYGRRV